MRDVHENCTELKHAPPNVCLCIFKTEESFLHYFLLFYIFTWIFVEFAYIKLQAWELSFFGALLTWCHFFCFYHEFIKHEICNKPTFFSHSFHSYVIFVKTFFIPSSFPPEYFEYIYLWAHFHLIREIMESF